MINARAANSATRDTAIANVPNTQAADVAATAKAAHMAAATEAAHMAAATEAAHMAAATATHVATTTAAAMRCCYGRRDSAGAERHCSKYCDHRFTHFNFLRCA
jgi:hypothetical protein